MICFLTRFITAIGEAEKSGANGAPYPAPFSERLLATLGHRWITVACCGIFGQSVVVVDSPLDADEAQSTGYGFATDGQPPLDFSTRLFILAVDVFRFDEPSELRGDFRVANQFFKLRIRESTSSGSTPRSTAKTDFTSARSLSILKIPKAAAAPIFGGVIDLIDENVTTDGAIIFPRRA